MSEHAKANKVNGPNRVNEASSLHPHEPDIPPALDAEGRCLVCIIQARAERIEAVARNLLRYIEARDHFGGGYPNLPLMLSELKATLDA